MGGVFSRNNKARFADYRTAPKAKPVADEGEIAISKDTLDFNGAKFERGVSQEDSLQLTLKSQRKLKFDFQPAPSHACKMTFSPSKGTLDKKHPTIKVKVTLELIATENLNFRVTLKTDSGENYFINVKARSEVGVFGSDPKKLELIENHGYMVPRVIAQMRDYLEQHDAYSEEGIFRLAGDQVEIKHLKEVMNRKQFESSSDINTMASLLKIWFRELPTPILNHIDQDSLMNCGDQEHCIAAYDKLPEFEKTLLDWLIDLMSNVCAKAAINKMTPQNLSIVVAPNLYEPATPDPMMGLLLSQKCAQFFMNVVNYKINQINLKSSSSASVIAALKDKLPDKEPDVDSETGEAPVEILTNGLHKNSQPKQQGAGNKNNEQPQKNKQDTDDDDEDDDDNDSDDQ